jgi:hypothetical protein
VKRSMDGRRACGTRSSPRLASGNRLAERAAGRRRAADPPPRSPCPAASSLSGSLVHAWCVPAHGQRLLLDTSGPAAVLRQELPCAAGPPARALDPICNFALWCAHTPRGGARRPTCQPCGGPDCRRRACHPVGAQVCLGRCGGPHAAAGLPQAVAVPSCVAMGGQHAPGRGQSAAAAGAPAAGKSAAAAGRVRRATGL